MPFLRGLVLEGLIFGGAYLRREICVSKPIGLALFLEVNLPFLLCFTLYLRAIFQVQAPHPGGGGEEAYIWKGDLTEVFFCVSGLGGFYSEGLIFGILRYAKNEHRPCWGRGRGSKQLKKKLLCMHFLQRSTI